MPHLKHLNLCHPRWLSLMAASVWLLASCSTSRAAQAEPATGNTYPIQILGQWEPGPEPCRLPLTYDSDSGFKITPQMLQGYEHTDTSKSVVALSELPQAWRIEAIEEYEGKQSVVTDIYVLKGDYLTVTDGQQSRTYRKCH